MQAQERDVFKKAGFLISIGFNQATCRYFRLNRSGLRSTEESVMLAGLDFVSHVTLLPLRSMSFSDIMIAVNVQPHVRCLVIFILTGQRPSTYLDTWGEEARIQPRPRERVR